MTRTKSTSIPRLQEIEFLRIAAEQVNAEATYDQIRRSLIDHMAAERERTQPSGNNAAIRLARHDEHRYMNNATDSLSELMRLGLVEAAHLPTTRKAAPVYADHTYRMTPNGRAWIDKLATDRRGAFDDLLRMLWAAHPQFAGMLRLLRLGIFAVPSANWREVHTERVGPEGREAYVRFLAARCARAIEAGVTGWQATEDEVGMAIRDYIRGRMEADARRQRPDRFLRNSDFVGACEEAVVSFAFGRAGVKLDYITLEIIRRWTKHLGVANFSNHVPAAPALRMWATATLDEDDRGCLTTITRRTVGDWGDRIIDELQGAFDMARVKNPRGDSFVDIYQVRAAVCSKLGLNDTVFDAAVGEFLTGMRRTDAPFRLHSDAFEYGQTPPTETPLRVRDPNTGRTLTYRVMTLIPR
jgi:hypothetical protein